VYRVFPLETYRQINLRRLQRWDHGGCIVQTFLPTTTAQVAPARDARVVLEVAKIAAAAA